MVILQGSAHDLARFVPWNVSCNGDEIARIQGTEKLPLHIFHRLLDQGVQFLVKSAHV